MIHRTPNNRRRRALSLGLGVALLGMGVLAGAAPVSADTESARDRLLAKARELAEERFGVEDERGQASAGTGTRTGIRSIGTPVDAAAVDGHIVSGRVLLSDPDGVTTPAADVLVELSGPWPEDIEEEWSDEEVMFVETFTAADGSYAFLDVPDGDYSLWFDPGEDSIYWPDYRDVTVAGGDLVVDDLILMPTVPLGALDTTGAPVLGETLEVVPSGWIPGTTFTYVWTWGRISGNEAIVGIVDDAVGNRYTVTPEHIGAYLIVAVLAENPGYEPLITFTMWEEPISAPRKAPAPAPVANSDQLGAFLVSHGSTPRPQTSAGLPAGSLSPAKDYSAEVQWDGADSFVDVYAYSSPLFVGTFPVVDGVAQVRLDSDSLTQLGAGPHTLVLLGQSSGDVGSLRLDVAAMLASTGTEPLPMLAGGGLLAGLGIALLSMRRRIRVQR